MRLGRRGWLPLAILGAVVACAWCSVLSAVGGWVAGQDLARREANIAVATLVAGANPLPPLGMLVTRLAHDSPAERAGVQRGDMVVAVNDVSVQDARDVRTQIGLLRPGDTVRLTIVRDRGQQQIAVQLAPFPDDQRRPYLGIYFSARGDEPADL